MSHDDPEAVAEQLRRGLFSMDDNVRMAAARALQQMPSHIQAIEDDLASDDGDIRTQASLRLEALAVYGDGEGLWPLIARWCSSDDPQVRQLVSEWALGPLLDKNFDRLFPRFENLALSDPRFASVALAALENACGPERTARIESLTQRLHAAGVAPLPPPSEPTLEQILDDDNTFFEDDLLQRLLGREDPSPAERASLLVLLLGIQVFNGGFRQFYYNADGTDPIETPAALRLIGAEEHAALVDEANACFGPEGPPADTTARRAAIEALGETARRRWGELDLLYYKLSDDLEALLRGYIRSHRDDFLDDATA